MNRYETLAKKLELRQKVVGTTMRKLRSQSRGCTEF